MTATQSDIAKVVGVSTVTVSRALRGHADLSAETRRRVAQAAEKLGYRRKTPAQPTQLSRVGAVTFGVERQFFYQSPIMQGMIVEIERELRERDIELALEFVAPGDVPVMVTRRSVDALLVFGRPTAEFSGHAKGIFALGMSGVSDAACPKRVCTDDLRGEKELVQHLIDRGHRDVLFVTPADDLATDTYRDRADGYTLAMIKHGFTPRIHALARDGFADAFTDLLAKHPGITAVACSHDGLARRVMEVCLRRGRKVPDDLSVVGFDNVADAEDWGITTHAPDWAAMGRLAVETLMHHDLHAPQAVRMVIPGRMVVRDSVAAPRAVER